MAKAVKTIEGIIQQVHAKTKEQCLSIGAPQMQSYSRIPFTIPELNRMTYGGLPKGRLIEFFGEEGGGKTTTALNIIASAQKEEPEKRAVYVDVEHTFDAVWAAKMGVDCEKLIVFDPTVEMSAGDILDICLDLIDTGEISVIVLDSIATMVSSQELEKDTDDKTYGGISAELTRFGKKAVVRCKATDTIFIGINQQREDMNSQYNLYRTPGGKAWKYLCSIRIEFRASTFIDQTGNETTKQCENPSGHLIAARLVKSKCFPSDKKLVTYTLNYQHGLDIVADVLECAIKLGIVQKAGAWLTWPEDEETEEVKWNGRVKAQEALRENSELFEALSQVVNEKLI